MKEIKNEIELNENSESARNRIKKMSEQFNHSDTNLFNWWIFDNNFGSNFMPPEESDDDMTGRDISTLDGFYDFLVDIPKIVEENQK